MYIFIVIFLVLFIAYVCWILWNRIRYNSLRRVSRVQENIPSLSATIVVPARNESKNIITLLESIFKAIKHHRIDVVVIDDHSDDNTFQFCSAFFAERNCGRVVSLADFVADDEAIIAYKKKAISVAVELSESEWIIQTDADCVVGPNWLDTISIYVNRYDANYFSGPVRMINMEYGWDAKVFHAFQALDFMTMQGITMAGYHKAPGQMSNGANLGYKRDFFNAVGGFSGIDQLASGDDMLLLDKFKQSPRFKSVYIKSSDAIVDTEMTYTIDEFVQQRIRWGSKSKHYKDGNLTLQLGLVFIVNVFFLLAIIYSFFDHRLLIFVITALLLKTFFELVLVAPLAKFFKQFHLVPYFLFLQPLHILYVVWVGFLSIFGGYKWKKRQVR